MDAFRADLARAKGKTLVSEFSGSWETEAPGGGSRSKMEQVAFGMSRDLVDPLRTSTGRDVLAACGVPPALVTPNTDGTSQRESLRRFLHSSLVPMARLIETECRLKLDAPDLVLDLSAIHAADTTGRSRAFASLIKVGVHADDASSNTGIVLTQPLLPMQGQDGA